MKTLQEIFEPRAGVDVIIDTDVFNELDDQFAIAYLFANQDRLNIKGITIAPFAPIYNKKVKDVAEGVRESLREVKSLLKLMETDFDKIYACADGFLPDENTPLESDAANFIVECSKNYSAENRLYIVAIGAITNVASAILKDPTIKDRIALVWLGGNAEHVWFNTEFNLIQDVAAARVVMRTDFPFMQVPCEGVVSKFMTGYYELEHFLKDKNPLCDFLFTRAVSTAREFTDIPTWHRVIWDVVAVATLLNDNGRYMRVIEKPRRLPNYNDGIYGEKEALSMLCVDWIERDALLYSLFSLLQKY